MANPGDVNWGNLRQRAIEVEKRASGESKRAEYMKFESGPGGKPNLYNVRLLGKAKEFTKFFVKTATGHRRAQTKVDDGWKAEEIIRTSTGKQIRGQQRYAVNIIDRADGKIKIMEGPISLFKHFANWSADNDDASPGGQSVGWDWQITVYGEGQSRGYSAEPTQPSPFTDEQAAEIAPHLYELDDRYKCLSPEEVPERLFGEQQSRQDAGPDPDGGPQSAPPAYSATAATAEPVAADGKPRF